MSAAVKRRWGSWGILIFTAWAAVLALVAVARILFFSKAVELAGADFGSPGQIWLVFGLNALFAVAFAACVYGFWQRFNWGRLLFLAAIVCWAGFSLWALFIPGTSHSAGNMLFSSGQALAGAAISVWYLNMPRIKACFKHQ